MIHSPFRHMEKCNAILRIRCGDILQSIIKWGTHFKLIFNGGSGGIVFGPNRKTDATVPRHPSVRVNIQILELGVKNFFK